MKNLIENLECQFDIEYSIKQSPNEPRNGISTGKCFVTIILTSAHATC